MAHSAAARLWLALAALAAAAHALTFQVPALDRACFHQALEAGVSHDADVLLLNEGPRGISFRVFSAGDDGDAGRRLLAAPKQRMPGSVPKAMADLAAERTPPADDPRTPVFERVFDNSASVFNLIEFEVPETGEYQICLDNDHRFIDQLIGFTMPFQAEDLMVDDALDGVSRGDMETVRRSLRQIQSRLSEIKSTQRKHLQREAVHRATADSNNERIFWLSLLETAVFLVVSAGQIIMVRRWFNLKPQRQWA